MFDALLSDEFVEYSKKILDIKKKYEDKKREFKVLYVAHKAELTSLENQAKTINDEWQKALSETKETNE